LNSCPYRATSFSHHRPRIYDFIEATTILTQGGKSTTQSHRAPIYYVDLTVRTGMTLAEALVEARTERQRRRDAGFDQAALDLAARVGFANGAFEELEEDGTSVVEEFYPEVGADEDTGAMGSIKDLQQNPLHDRLDLRLNGRQRQP
jgi:hypothetical protein